MDPYEFVDDDPPSSKTTIGTAISYSIFSQESASFTQETISLSTQNDLVPTQTSDLYPFGYKEDKFEFIGSKFTSGRRINTKIAIISSGSENGQTFEYNSRLKCGTETWRCNFSRQCKSRVYRLINGKFVKCPDRFIAHAHEQSERNKRKIASLEAMQEVKRKCADIQCLVKDEGVKTVEQIFEVMEKEK